jgi:transposase
MPYRPFDRQQVFALPPALDDWVPPDHAVRFVAAFLDAISAAQYEQMGIDLVSAARGAPAYHPLVLLGAWVGGFVSGIRSSRKLEAACHDTIPLRWLTANQTPDHNTLWRFYQQHRNGMRRLLARTVEVALAADLVPLAVLAVDGTKVAGNAARDRTYDAAGLAGLLTRVDGAIADLEAQNSTSADDGPPRLPPGLAQAQALRTRVQLALEQVQAPDGPSRINLTDGDAGLLKTRQGWVVGYNAQAAVTPTPPDAAGLTGLLITAAEVTTDPDDHAQLLPVLAASQVTTGQQPAAALADGGYHSGPALAACAAAQQRVVMPETQTREQLAAPYHQERFVYEAAADQLRCPHGQVLPFRFVRQHPDGEERVYRAAPAVCRGCAAFGICTTNRRQGREVALGPYHHVIRQHRAWMATAEAQALRRQRQTLVEPAFGILKEQQGLRRFLLRGRAAVQAEWRLLAAAFNLRTLARYWRAGQLVLTPAR